MLTRASSATVQRMSLTVLSANSCPVHGVPQLLAGFLLLVLQSVAAQSLVLEHTFALPAVQGRLDHMDLDAASNRLFVAALGADSVEVIDLKAGQRVASLRSLHQPQGVAYMGPAQRLFVANGGGGVTVFRDGSTPFAKIEGLDDADNIRFDSQAGHLYVGHGRALAVIDPGTLRIAQRIELAGHPEAFELESRGSRIYVNVPSAGHIAVVDRSTGRITASWTLGGASGNFAMAIDETGRRLFVATRQPAWMLVYDIDTGKRTASLEICGDADDLFFDQRRRQLYAVCGEGMVEVIRQRDADHYAVIERVRTSNGARTGLFVADSSTLFVALPARGVSRAEIRAYKVVQ
jgi:DNA-binding beta-propeller fold protein YncE